MREIDGKKVKLFSLSSNVPLAKEIAKTSDIPLSVVDVLKFADGEISVNIEESVRGCHVFVIQSTSSPANEHYMELFIMIDALKRASASSINIIMPYYGYSRQDRKSRSREPITAKLVADMIQSAGASRVVCIDLHVGQIQGFFDIPIDNFPAAPLIATYFKRKKINDLVIVSPDHGGATRARTFARLLGGAPLAIIDKRRPQPNMAEVVNIIGEVKGKTALIVDDIIDTAGTLIAAAQAIKNAGATEVYAAASHPVLSPPAVERLENSCIKEVIVTNTIEIKEKTSKKIKQLSIGPLLGEAILHLVKDEAISQIFNRMDEE
jgi:ribose-phosphate pyrophosphokinase